MKIKVFKFNVSNPSSMPADSDKDTTWYPIWLNKLQTPEQIECVVNAFCEGKEIIDIKINNVDMQYHNNGRGNTIELWYTIMYKGEM